MSERPAEGPGRRPAASTGPAVAPLETSVLAFVDTLRRRRGLFAGALVTFLIAALVAVFAITPRYTARAVVMVDPREERVVDIETVLARLTADDSAVQSEVEVLRSEELGQRVIARTALDRSQEFNPALTASLGDMVLRSLNWPWLNAAFGDILADSDDAARAQRAQAEVLAKYLDRLDVTALGRGSRAIQIAFSSKDPETAAMVANTVADVYLSLQLDSKLRATSRASDWLQQRLSGVGEQLAASEHAIEDARAAIVAEGGWAPDLFEQKIAQINGQLVQAEAAYEQAQAELNQIESVVTSGGPEAIFEAVDPQLLIWTNEQLMWLRRTEAELKARFGEDHPIVAEMRDATARSIEETADRLIAGARNRVEVAGAKVRALDEYLKRLVEESIGFRREQVRLRALEREAKATTDLYETLLTRSKETAQTGLEQPDARIVSHASVPGRPSFPNRLLLIGAALVGSVALSGTLVGVAEGLERGYRNAEQLQAHLPVRVLGEIPAVRKPAVPLAEWLLGEPASAYAEALRSLSTSIELSDDLPAQGKILLITSSLPQEGKTTVVTSLARTMAANGRRVLVVDCDLRHPSAHRELQLEQEPGLGAFLAGDGQASELIQEDGRSGVHLIAAGDAPQGPLQLLRSERLADLLQDLRARYDVILIDSPPVLPIADTRLLGSLADRCIFVVRWRATDRNAAQQAFEQLTQARGQFLGAVLNRTKDGADRNYGYAYASYRAAYGSRGVQGG